jgi:predicted regulator of Ras-like GTPase activity (Roadblock/LC7/MglB family)
VTTTTMDALGVLSRLRGVRCALVASERDGLAIESVSHVDVDVEALAAFATSLYRRARQMAGAAGFGSARLVGIDAANGRVVAAAHGDLVVIALAERDTHPGLLRVTLQRALAALA